ncbi:MAG: S-methyl-5'-thioadenosine phosphorylase [Deltaproteobacteria bacterium]|nr:S-methyl-5'-thioadenosine phosphorylase [Deltaproteobacteria bacterium]
MTLGILGGTGLYALPDLEVVERRQIDTPFGTPSAAVVLGRWHGRNLAFLPRHGEQHALLPSEINFRANLWALKTVGVREVVAVSAVGSLREEVRPGELCVVGQYLDWTRGRPSTFFGGGLVAHISSAEPACPRLTALLTRAATAAGQKLGTGKTYACVEGPRLGTRAESFFLRDAGADVVGMTAVPEVFLAREAQLCYLTLAVVTDYDCWKDDPAEHASVQQVMARYREAQARVQKLLAALLREQAAGACACRTALKQAVLSREESLTPEHKALLALLRA